MSQFEIVVGQIVGFFIMMMIGYGCVRLRFYGMKTLDGMCMLLTRVLIPLLVFSNAVDGTTRAELVGNWGIMLLTAIMYASLMAVFAVVAWAIRLRGSRSHLFQAGFIFGNAGFIGIPLVLALFPKHGALFIVLMSIVDQALLWTYGVWLCEPVKERGRGGAGAGAAAESAAAASAAAATAGAGAAGTSGSANPVAATGSGSHPSPHASPVLALLRRFANPAIAGILIALVIIIADWQVPPMVLTPLHTIGQMATPLSLFYLGGLFALTKWWGVFKRYELYVGLVVKMLAFPIGFYFAMTALAAMTPLPITHEMIQMMSLISGLPTMTTVAMFAGRSKNMPEYAVGLVLVSTLFSLASLTAISTVIF
ncbi:permease [Bifidobacterium sp. UTCIF-39]|uniref:AEC family transporter n=1 Tax=Bifidobacterium sp. UTCIF-39 TaxID=1465359 RepID=UPI001126D005|nr:AEC family transporter [Bifidobacterium sp. UTCIF-39]TPF95736.1 permease [Bifidobacterium sp. UTCIF-39]